MKKGEWIIEEMRRIFQSIAIAPKRMGAILFSISILFLGTGIGLGMIIDRKKEDQVQLDFSTSSSFVEEADQENEDRRMAEEDISSIHYVDIKGAVKSPGIYSFSPDERIYDVLKKAGGLTETADEDQLNLAAKVADQQVIYVPTIGEEIPESARQEPIHTVEELETNKQEEKINLNTADLAQLQQLPRIGEIKAQEIIRYREENGSFQKIEELQEISGIGAKTIEQMRDLVTVSGS